MHVRCNYRRGRYFHSKSKKASELGRLRANRRWELDRARRDRLAQMEKERQENLVVILRDNRTGEERVFPYDRDVWGRVRYFAECFCEW